ncbi:GNAT family N-acetyltransferase [Oceanirhabdus sp. W0125-5]|uniref:GNAT family N-acetyltransferase n=1 Tax=Oceanirhabdus sp. W0125-5 TaxID=2999116 RepID=UPI0022F2A832|nr:GNAT family N-acetyltransferase [Oceanirhabdus sp. W0125-5]WBW95895.1 GNAT family N-acetyltransferase [Oceanirhabdus sp. W0125-5]
MIYELKKEEFSNVLPLCVGKNCNLEIISILQGNNYGWVFADNPQKPRSAVIWSRAEGFYFIGESNNHDFNDFLTELVEKNIKPRSLELQKKYFEYSFIEPEWEEVLKKIFEYKNLENDFQRVYKLYNYEEARIAPFDLEEGFEIKEVTEDIFKENLNNLEFIKNDILHFWGCNDKFFEMGKGYCIIKDNHIVSICMMSNLSDKEAQAHIETLPEFRKKGFAKRMLIEYLKHCRENHLTPYWDCTDDNIGSYSTAESLGYELAFKYPLYWTKF